MAFLLEGEEELVLEGNLKELLVLCQNVAKSKWFVIHHYLLCVGDVVLWLIDCQREANDEHSISWQGSDGSSGG